MKKKLRRKLKGFQKIGNYIYADNTGKLAVVFGESRITEIKVDEDFYKLLMEYGTECAKTFLLSVENYVNS